MRDEMGTLDQGWEDPDRGLGIALVYLGFSPCAAPLALLCFCLFHLWNEGAGLDDISKT